MDRKPKPAKIGKKAFWFSLNLRFFPNPGTNRVQLGRISAAQVEQRLSAHPLRKGSVLAVLPGKVLPKV